MALLLLPLTLTPPSRHPPHAIIPQESAQYNLKESQTMLHDAKAALKKELKSKQARKRGGRRVGVWGVEGSDGCEGDGCEGDG